MTPKAAVSALRRLPLFERVSLRLLQDLVEFASLETWWDEPDEACARDEAAMRRLGLLQSTRPGGAVSERRFQGRWLREALEASFSLARAFEGRHRELFDVLAPDEREGHVGEPPAMHWLLLTKDERFAEPGRPDTDVDLSAAAALLARALARTTTGLREGAVVATLDAQGVTLQRWDAHGAAGAAVQLAVASFGTPGGPDHGRPPFPSAQLAEACRKLGGSDGTAWHVVCVAPADPRSLPAWWRDRFRPQGFHRIIYLTRPGRKLRPPTSLLSLLLPGAWNPRRKDGPYFSSVVPTVVLADRPVPRNLPFLTRWGRDLPTLEVCPWDDFDGDDARPEPRTIDARLRRDLCRIRVKVDHLATCDREPAIADSLDRWARAVTNRQVGLALSGGGATSAALVPFLEELARYGIPCDVVGSFSGGAILGLYLATGKLPSYYQWWRRLKLALVVPSSMCWSRWLQLMLNQEFGDAHLEDLDVRFVPMTVELRGDGSPRACAVIGGTLGEAVRVSGIGLGLFGPAERRGTRYVDGGVAFGVPAAVLPDFGADMVIGCNSIVPPRGRDLNAFLPVDIGRVLELMPWVDIWWNRMSDVVVGVLTTLRQSARQGAEDADVYYEVSPDETPFLDSFRWFFLDRIRNKALMGRGWEDALDLAIRHWERLRGGRA